ncbi:MAG: ferritin-like domain-containing protein [Proteobacteria bacterium]|nr:ferritin-like domain-containing protein [Pseudomonadota bacterium]MBW2721006.1 ferritin-like domain-containing protein [Deltaproteobacteria bacterium]
MEKQELITMLNRDLADEHAAILRYLIHSYLEGEDTPLGASLLSRAREEMWHMHWLGMIIGRLGGEPNLAPAPYPYDPTNRATIFKSYVDYELKLIPHYNGEADKVDDPHIKRVLQREAWESEYHARKFQRILDKMTPEQAEGLPDEENELPEEFVERLQGLVASKYTEMLQHIRSSWVFQQESIVGWQLMDFAMTKMKQLAHLAEEVAENGIAPRFEVGKIDLSASIGTALKKGLEDVRGSREEHITFQGESETQKHAGLLLSLDLALKQEEYEAAEIEDWSKKS